MKVSILCPSRKRKEVLEKSLMTLQDNFSFDGNDLEFLLAFDNDDKESLLHALEHFSSARILVVPRWGYKRLNWYYNALCGISTGDWLFLWNDDCYMKTKNWDKVIERHNGQFLFLHPKSNHPISDTEVLFPIVPRKYYEVLGHFSLNAHNDTWVQEIAYALGRVQPIPVTIFHDRADITGQNRDSTFKEREYQRREFVESYSLREKDIETLRKYLDNRGGEAL